MIVIKECPVCKSQSLTLFRTCKDDTVSHETFHVLRCDGCTLGITSPQPESENLGKYYESDEYISHSGKSSGGIGAIYKVARNFALNWKRKLVTKKSPVGTALDFGCGTGEFLNTLKQAGWTVEGVEPSEIGRTKASELTGQPIHNTLASISASQFDIITAWHVIEHISSLEETIHQLKKLLKKDGTIFIAVPNYQSTDANRYQEHWAGFDVPRHLWHFSKKSMQHLLTTHGLKVTEIIPMKLDAYYVSMLSEKYRTGKTSVLKNLFRGFVNGLQSNVSAQKTVNHSSLIYVAKHA
jgi:2-polyprenyl-3-methyl-5-hydroxy-6-metoxy-1,4-benzoquinol methylase